MKKKYLYLFLIILTIAAITIFNELEVKKVQSFWNTNANPIGICESGKGCTDNKNKLPGFGIGNIMPNITLYNNNGKQEKFFDIVKGKEHIILNLGTDWCSDCIEEKKRLVEMYSEIDENTIIINVFIDFENENNVTSQDSVKEYVQENDFPFPTYYDINNELLRNFNVNSSPTNIYINKSGQIKFIGQEITIEEVLKLISKKE